MLKNNIFIRKRILHNKLAHELISYCVEPEDITNAVIQAE